MPETTAADDEQLHDWHITFLLELGVGWDVAQQFADQVDLHEVARYVGKGCPPDLAVQIAR